MQPVPLSTKSAADQTVTLGQYRTASFMIDDMTAQVLHRPECDPKVAATAAVAFSGQADNTNPALVAPLVTIKHLPQPASGLRF